MPILAAMLALLAALSNALSAALQHHASPVVAADHPRRATGPGGPLISRYLPVLRQVPRLLRRPVWWSGWAFNTLGTLVQAAALQLGSVALVQPLMTTQLVFDLPLSALETRVRPLPRDWLAVIAVCGGVALFLSVPGAAPTVGAADRPRILAAILGAAVTVVLLVAFAAGRSSAQRAAVFGVAAGVVNAVTAILLKLTTTDLFERGIAATAADWPGYGVALTTTLGILLAQQAYAAGSLPVAVAAMTVTNPTVSYVLGRVGFHLEGAGDPGTLAVIVISLVALSAGAVTLAHSPTIRLSSAPPRARSPADAVSRRAS